MSDSPTDVAEFPDEWTSSAREVWRAVLTDYPDLKAAAHAALWEACNLIALADRLEETIEEHGLMTTGSAGQLVVNPAVTECRQLRTAAVLALGKLGIATADASSNMGRALARHRWSAIR